MNFKQTIAGISALCLVGAIAVTNAKSVAPKTDANAGSLFGDINADGRIDASDASLILGYYSYLSTTSGTPVSLEKYLVMGTDMTAPATPSVPAREVSLKTGGDVFTVAAWNNEDAPYIIANWLGINSKTFLSMIEYGNTIITPSGAELNYINFNVGGGAAPEKYDAMFNSGKDLDVYFAEPDWAHKYMDDDKRSAPLSALGITEDDMKDMYPYTKTLAKNSSGVYKSAPFAVAPGAFAYRTDLAELYLGVTSPEEMQTAVSDLSKFVETAEAIAVKTGSQVALADSISGMWNVYSCGKTFVTNGNQLYLGSDVQEFAQMANELCKFGGVTRNNQWTDEWISAGQQGKCMGYFVPSWGYGGFFKDVSDKTAGKWAVCAGPQPYYWGGYSMLVNPATDNGDDASSFMLSSAFNHDTMKQYASQSSEMPNNMAVNSELAEANFYYNQSLSPTLNNQNYYAILDQNAKAISLDSYTKYDYTVKWCILNGITDEYIKNQQGRNWDTALSKIKNSIYEKCPDLIH